MENEFEKSPEFSAARRGRYSEPANIPINSPLPQGGTSALDRRVVGNVMSSFGGGGLGEAVFMSSSGAPIVLAGLNYVGPEVQPVQVPEQEKPPVYGPSGKPFPDDVDRIGGEPKKSDFKDYGDFFKWLETEKKKDVDKGRGEQKAVQGITLESFYDEPGGDAPPVIPLQDINCGEEQLYEAGLVRYFDQSLCVDLRIDTKLRDTDDPKDPVDPKNFDDLLTTYWSDAKAACESQHRPEGAKVYGVDEMFRKVRNSLEKDGTTDRGIINEILMPLKRAADSMECLPNPGKCDKHLDIVYYYFDIAPDPVEYLYRTRFVHADTDKGEENYQALITVYFRVKLKGFIWFKIKCVNKKK